MTHRHVQHAHRVVESFKANLSESGRSHVGDKHFDELALLIESAISAAVLEAMEMAADRVDKLAQSLRASAERFD